ncbi:MAG TPA: efflux RND transporter periplasmic adaptor subunit [Alphaproteobacteria bacterium]|nr:efflux RND transporter periplasmic adaptor subunit [Alphaproteobacteria bacterium]
MQPHLRLGIVALAYAAGLAACEEAGKSTQQAAGPPPAVGVATVERRELSIGVDFTGRVEAIDKVELRARVLGFLDKRQFTEGQTVKEGELLFVIEKDQYQAQVEQQKADVARAEAEQVNAAQQLQRGRELLRNNNISAATVDERAAREGVARAQVQQAKAALREAEINLGYTDIHAPIGGRIGRSTYTVGAFVGPESGTLATIVRQDPVYVSFPVTQRMLTEIRRRVTEGEAAQRLVAKVRLADGKFHAHPGKISFVDVQVDRGTDTVIVRAEVPNPEGFLVDGQFVTVVIEREQPEKLLVIPSNALQADQAGTFVLAVDSENKVVVKRVVPGGAREGYVIVQQGVNEGDKIIVEGVQKVRPGQVVAPGPPSAGGA